MGKFAKMISASNSATLASRAHDLEEDVLITKDSKKSSLLRNIDDPWEPSQK